MANYSGMGRSCKVKNRTTLILFFDNLLQDKQFTFYSLVFNLLLTALGDKIVLDGCKQHQPSCRLPAKGPTFVDIKNAALAKAISLSACLPRCGLGLQLQFRKGHR